MPKVLFLTWDRVSEIKDAFGNKQYKPEDIQELFRKLFYDVQNIHKELTEFINTPSWNRPAFYNNDKDDDKDYTIAITPDFSITDSLSMRDEHLSTISKMESDKLIKSSVENLVSNPSYDDESFSNEDVPKEIYSNPLLDDEIISFKIDLRHFNVEFDLIESLLNQDSSIISSSKIVSLLDEFAGELIFLKSIPPGIDEADCDPEEEIHLIKKLFDSLMEEINLSLTLDDSMPPDIENDDYDSKRDILFLEELLSFSFPKNESFHFDVPSSPYPLAKPLDDYEIEPDTGIWTVKVVGDISEHYVLMPRLLPTQPTLASNEEKSTHLLSHLGFKAFQLCSEIPMMVYEGDSPTLDVSFLHFYPP
uniref:Reverse transcriptase domain-containing protein n=1 Tax=Tanacetum cinerariifolium TaxID=118510 RepID=A0A6L2LN07_TANCI|nr:hypothetical protein [Tanacetum cinerariifolium]